jgi:hypothetical protein
MKLVVTDVTGAVAPDSQSAGDRSPGELKAVIMGSSQSENDRLSFQINLNLKTS